MFDSSQHPTRLPSTCVQLSYNFSRKTNRKIVSRRILAEFLRSLRDDGLEFEQANAKIGLNEYRYRENRGRLIIAEVASFVVRCSSLNFKQHRLFKPEMNHIRRANGIATEIRPKVGPNFAPNLFPVVCLLSRRDTKRVVFKSRRETSCYWRANGAKTNARFRVEEKLSGGRDEMKRIRNCAEWNTSSSKCLENGLRFLFACGGRD